LIEEWLADNILLLKSSEPLEQFREIIRHFNIAKPKELFTRCLVCNTVLRSANAEEIAENMPLDAMENQSEFYYCRNCSKIYWRGSHTRRMQATVEQIFAQMESPN
jgi:uncharacterized protein with PIN domain